MCFLKRIFLIFQLFLAIGCNSPNSANEAVQPAPATTIPDTSELPQVDTAWDLLPELVICKPLSGDAFIYKSETEYDETFFQSCRETCDDWKSCTQETMIRGRIQSELFFVVNEDKQGNGFGGLLRFTKANDRQKMVLFHKGGSGTEWVEDFLPEKVEDAGGVAIQPKWNAVGPGWFSRPHSNSKLNRSLHGVTQRPAAVMKWIYLNLTEQKKFATAACSGGSIATYYPRHWFGIDQALNYQLLAGGPVMAKIDQSCRGGGVSVGRCTLNPLVQCNTNLDCSPSAGTCSSYEWSGGLVMTAVRATIDHLHSQDVSGQKSCFNRTEQPAFAVSDFDSEKYQFDRNNEHKIDFLMNVSSSPSADNGLNVLASGALIYESLSGQKTWTVQSSGIHCDALNSDLGWSLLRSGIGL